MIFSINNRLTAFAQQGLVLGYSDAERNRINSSLVLLERNLKEYLYSNVKELIRFGSYTRNTILPRKYDAQSDVDIMVVFDTGSGRKTPATYRRNIVKALSAAYPSSTIRKDFPTVKLELNHIMFDVVPAYCQELWSNTYYIPSANDSWQEAQPNDINDDLSKKNQSYGNNIVRNVIRLCKHWNSRAGYPFESYIMEKWIVERYFYSGDNLYEKFLSVLSDMAGTRPGVRHALEYIEYYKGNWLREPNDQKQFEWLQKLLPGLR